MRQIFNKLNVLAFYDNSDDGTLDILNDFKANCAIDINIGIGVDILINSESRSTLKTENIAFARNALLKQIKENFSNYEYFMMLDTNEYACIGDINLRTLENAMTNNNEWDAISFDRVAGYYDLWALSFDPYIYSFFHFNQDWKLVLELMRESFTNLLAEYRKNKPAALIPVYSAYNGFSLYKTNKFLNCAYNTNIQLDLFPAELLQKQIELINSPLSNRTNDDCEHRAFHLEAIRKNGAKIMVSTQFLFAKCIDPPKNMRGAA
jgi:hypothetical protein